MNANDRPTDPGPAFSLQDIAGLVTDLKAQIEKKGEDDAKLYAKIFENIGNLAPLMELYGRLVVRLDSVVQELEEVNFRLTQRAGEAADVLSRTVSLKDFQELKTRVRILEKAAGAGNDVDETKERTDREVGTGSR